MVQNTILGRETDNMWDIEKDSVLKYLYDYHTNPFNFEDTPLLAIKIADDLDLALSKVEDILKRLVSEGLVDLIEAGNKYYSISSKGVEAVEQLIRKL